jgi:hypothetical protein
MLCMVVDGAGSGRFKTVDEHVPCPYGVCWVVMRQEVEVMRGAFKGRRGCGINPT